MLWFDPNGDGVQDTSEGSNEFSLAGATVQISWQDDETEATFTLTTMTDENGQYSFENLAPETYSVTVLQLGETPPGNLLSNPSPATAYPAEGDTDAVVSEFVITNIQLDANEQAPGYNFSYQFFE
jgi:hypothetical protein